MTTTTIDTFQDILTAIGSHPDLRRQLIKELFPDVDITRTLQELAEAIKAIHDRLYQIEQDVSQLKTDVGVLKTDVGVLKTDVGVLKTDVGVLKTDVGVLKTDVGVLKTDVGVLKTDVGVLKTDVGVLKTDVGVLKTDAGTLKGKSHESDIQRNVAGIFGRWVRRGHDGRNDLADAMFEAGAAADDVDEVLASDYIFTGILRGQDSISLIIESSHFAEIHDINRAKTRAQLAVNAGIRAYPLVTAEIWSSDMIAAAEALGVIIVHGKRMNKESWSRVVET